LNHLVLNRRPGVQTGKHYAGRRQWGFDLTGQFRIAPPEKGSENMRMSIWILWSDDVGVSVNPKHAKRFPVTRAQVGDWRKVDQAIPSHRNDAGRPMLLDRLPRFSQLAQHDGSPGHSIFEPERFARLRFRDGHCLDRTSGDRSQPSKQLRPEVIFGSVSALP
jgi:hypothetical protein